MDKSDKDMLTAIVIVAMICATIIYVAWLATNPGREYVAQHMEPEMTLVEKVDAINQKLKERGFTGIEVKIHPKH